MTLAQEKGSSNWLSTLPIKEHGFILHKSNFRDAMMLRYGWTPDWSLAECPCGVAFTIDYSLSCPKGGLPIRRHNEVREFTAGLFKRSLL